MTSQSPTGPTGPTHATDSAGPTSPTHATGPTGPRSLLEPPLDPALFDLEPGVLWAMHCAEGPVPRAAVAAALAMLQKELRPWRATPEDWLGLPTRVRAAAAALLGGAATDYTLGSSTSSGLTAIAQSFPWRPGDEVLAPLGEFPSNIYPWKALAPRGVQLREVPLWDGHLAGSQALASTPPPPQSRPEERLLDAIGPRTRLVTASWVRFQDGLRLDLEALARGCATRGVPLVIDGIQGAGTLPLALHDSGVAAFATGVHKGLLSPQGVGLLWTEERFRAQLTPIGSWLSVEDGGDFHRPSTDHARAWLRDGRMLELGGLGLITLAPLESSLSLLKRTGLAAIAAHTQAVTRELLAGLAGTLWDSERERLLGLSAAGRLGPIVSLHHSGRGAAFLEAVHRVGQQGGVQTSIREGYLRIALHGWHSAADIERMTAWLRG